MISIRKLVVGKFKISLDTAHLFKITWNLEAMNYPRLEGEGFDAM
jgi:hypothetical protein